MYMTPAVNAEEYYLELGATLILEFICQFSVKRELLDFSVTEQKF